MDLGLSGKRALVLAASSGLGLATAQALAGEGARVAVCSRELARAQAAADGIAKALGGNAGSGGGAASGAGSSGAITRGAASRTSAASGAVTPFAADVSKADDLERLVADADAALGGLDILVCNAGGPPPGNFATLSEEQWDRAYGLTLQSVVRSVRLALPAFRRAGGGSVLVLASSSVKQPIPNLLLSNVFRPAIQALCKHLSIELASDNVRVNCLSPGRIETPRIGQIDRARAEREGMSLEAVRAETVAAIPLGRLGRPEEFGRVAAFLCSDAASYMTGSSVFVDGGMVKCL